MRILQLPYNIASQISNTVRALRDIGQDARGLCLNAAVIQDVAGMETYYVTQTGSWIRRLIPTLIWWNAWRQAIQWADVVHWYFNWGAYQAFDVRWAKFLGKKRVVEFCGSDIRIPEIESQDNPYYACIIHSHEYAGIENYAGSRNRQLVFAKAGATIILPYKALSPYIQSDIIKSVHYVPHRIYLSDYQPCFCDPLVSRPLVIHSPSASMIKGTSAVLAAIETLQGKVDFNFKLVQNLPHQEAKKLAQTCDIFLDQFVLGAHGVAALEAMAYGKPVICYIKPSLMSQYPQDLPIVNATQETLPDVLSELIQNGKLRRELGERGRAYVEKYHDAHKLAQRLVETYQ